MFKIQFRKFANILQQLNHFDVTNFNEIIQICYWHKIAFKQQVKTTVLGKLYKNS